MIGSTPLAGQVLPMLLHLYKGATDASQFRFILEQHVSSPAKRLLSCRLHGSCSMG